MKAVILGGGIAGMTAAILLKEKGWQVVVNERLKGVQSRGGHAFLMHNEGLSVLRAFKNAGDKKFKSKKVNIFSLKRPDGEEIKRIQLDYWHSVKRLDVVNFLSEHLTDEDLKEGRDFSHFIYENGIAKAAVFLNGDVEFGDIFIGADGRNSKVRDAIHEKVNFTSVDVKEVVGITQMKDVSNNDPVVFQKYLSKDKGLSFGYIPAYGDDVVWFMQVDTSLFDTRSVTPDCLKTNCYKLLKDFPEDVHRILDANNFYNTYLWNTTDFNLLPYFHKENIVLIGDAAHLALPFTSAGTTNAIKDAQVLVNCLEHALHYEEAFEGYYKLRSEEVKNHTQQGRELKESFLHPEVLLENEIRLPLIIEDEKATGKKPVKPLKILYFTDPVCSTCWIIQPLLRKLKLHYDKYIEIEYRMGGMLPSWNTYEGSAVSSPTEAAKHWEEVSSTHNMPIDGDIWLEDPLDSSYPPSIAFKAAQLQSNDKAVLFLRRLKEMVFIEKKNISKWQFIEKAALSSGLDSARLLKDIEGKALSLFSEDLAIAKDLNVNLFPTLFFFNEAGQRAELRGYQSFEKFEEVIHHLLPGVQKMNLNRDPISLFTEFNNMTDLEFSFLSNISLEEAAVILNKLFQEEVITRYESKNGVIWIYDASRQVY